MRLGWIAAVAVLVLGTTAAQAAPVKITTQWKGAAMPLDVVNGGEFDNFAHLAPAADVSGQLWTMRPESGGTFRLTHASMSVTPSYANASSRAAATRSSSSTRMPWKPSSRAYPA